MALRTKWDVLCERLFTAQAEATRLREELHGMNRTPCGAVCIRCGETLDTEGEFARHFLIPDERYLNLGRCPR